jgi:acetyl-CoA C-acetyltransferase
VPHMDGSTGVWVLGGYQSDFARNLTKEGRDFASLTAEIVELSLAAAKVEAADVDVMHVGNAFGEMFAEIADEYDRRYGLDDAHLRAIAQLNFANARRNPNAQTRGWTIPEPITDGGAGLVLVNDGYLREPPDARPIGRIEGWGHRTVGLGLRQKLDRAADDPYVVPHVRAAVLDALRRPRLTLDDLDGFEVHDCFTPSEYLAIDHIGLTGPGESWKAIENGEVEIGGRLPINPSGGLIGGGHPVGASGVRMLLDAAKQVSGAAGDYQVEDAKTVGTLNFGGSTATTVSFVVRTTEGS